MIWKEIKDFSSNLSHSWHASSCNWILMICKILLFWCFIVYQKKKKKARDDFLLHIQTEYFLWINLPLPLELCNMFCTDRFLSFSAFFFFFFNQNGWMLDIFCNKSKAFVFTSLFNKFRNFISRKLKRARLL